MLDRYKQIAVQLEAQEGVHEGSEASGDLITTKNLNWEPEFERYEREHAVQSLSPTEDIGSRAKGRVTFEIEVAGPTSGSLTAEAPFGLLVRACGARVEGLDDSNLNPFRSAGEQGNVFYVSVANTAAWSSGTQLDNGLAVTDGTTGTGTVLGTYFSADDGGKIVIRNDGSAAWASSGTITASGIAITYTGAPVAAGHAYIPADKPTYLVYGTVGSSGAEGEIVTGVTSGARGLITYYSEGGGEFGALVERAPGYGFFQNAENVTFSGGGTGTAIGPPVQFDIPSLSITFYNDGNRVRLAGARGTCVQRYENGKAGILEVTLEGNHTSEATSAPFALVADAAANPPMFMGGSMTLDGTFHPLISALTIDHGREFAMRSDVEQASGWSFCGSFSRTPAGTLDAEAVQEGIYGFIEKARTAAGVVIEADYGTGGSQNAFLVRAPNAQFNISPGERDGQVVYQQELKLFSKAGTRGDEHLLLAY